MITLIIFMNDESLMMKLFVNVLMIIIDHDCDDDLLTRKRIICM